MPKTPTPIAAAEVDLATLQHRRVGLDARKTVAAGALVTATAERRRLLVEHDNPPAAELTKADCACRDARDSDDAAADALAELDRRIAAARELVERLTSANRRDGQAKAIEAAADRAAEATARLRAAAAEIGSAVAALAEAIPLDAAACYAPTALGGGTVAMLTTTQQFYDGRAVTYPIDPGVIALRLAGHALAAVLPGYAITTADEAGTLRGNGFPTPVLAPAPDAAALDAAMVGPMRAHAAAVRSGATEVEAVAAPSHRPPRRQADVSTTDTAGNTFDRDGAVLTLGGFYPEEAAA